MFEHLQADVEETYARVCAQLPPLVEPQSLPPLACKREDRRRSAYVDALRSAETPAAETPGERVERLATEIRRLERALARDNVERPEGVLRHAEGLQMQALVLEEQLRLAFANPSTAWNSLANKMIIFYELNKGVTQGT